MFVSDTPSVRGVTDGGDLATSPHCIKAEAERDSSWDIIRSVQEGNIALFGEIYRRYAPTLLRYFLSKNLDVTVAEDLTSETFLRALRAIDTVSEQGSDIRAWLIAIGRNIGRDYFRAARYCSEISMSTIPDAGDIVVNPETQILGRLEFEEVADQLRRLSPYQLRCLILRRVLNNSVGDTALRMDITGEAVRTLLHRATKRLRKLTTSGSTQ